jgi:hypothetical protein
VANLHCIKKDYNIKEVRCPIIFDAAHIVYPYEFTSVCQDESHYTVPIQRQASIQNRCRHLCRSLPHSFAAAVWCHHCELKINLHPKHEHCDTFAGSGRKPRGKVQSCVGYRVCFGTTGVVLLKPRDVEIWMLSLCIMPEDMREEVYAGRSDIYIRVPMISWFIF